MSTQGLLQILVILFHVIYPYRFSLIFFLFSYFTPKLFLLHLYQVLGLSLCILHFLIDWLVFVSLESLVLIVLLDPVTVSFKCVFRGQYLLIDLFKLHCQTCLLFCSGLFFPNCVFSFLSTLTYHNFFTCFSSLTSYPGFVFLFRFLRRTQI